MTVWKDFEETIERPGCAGEYQGEAVEGGTNSFVDLSSIPGSDMLSMVS
jgi:hypothetical protein